MQRRGARRHRERVFDPREGCEPLLELREIDDAAAQTFSFSFYKNMFMGRTFGDAVRQARSDTYQSHHLTNTWGAYQCYGEPDWRLVAGHYEQAGRFDDAKRLFEQVALADEFVEFLTLPAYELID